MRQLFQPLLFLLASCTEHELRRHIEFLQAENEMLRKRVPKQRIFLSKVECERLLRLGPTIGPGETKLITIVHPRTDQRWIRVKSTGINRKQMGCPKTLESLGEIVLRIAKETGWRYGRILGEVKRLQLHAISQSTIQNILKESGMLPRPKPGQGTWDAFLKMHAETLWQIDFFSKSIWTTKGLRQWFVLAFIHVARRQVCCSPCTFLPNTKWIVGQVAAFLEHARTVDMRVDYVTRDRDGMFVAEFEAAFRNSGSRVIPTTPRAPNQNVDIERWIKSITLECLRSFIVCAQLHLVS